MADPVSDAFQSWKNDAAGADTNTPQGSSLMNPGGATELAGELRQIKSSMRIQCSQNNQWERWINLYGTLAYVDATHFTLTGDRRVSNGGPVEVGRCIKCSVTAGTVYGYIGEISYDGTKTSVQCLRLDTSLDSGLSEVQFGNETLYARAFRGDVTLDSQFGPNAVSGTSETTLFTYTIPSDILGLNEVGLDVTCGGLQATNGNTRVLRLYFGATTVGVFNISLAANAVQASWFAHFQILRSGASAQFCHGTIVAGSGNPATAGVAAAVGNAGAEDPTLPIIVKVTGQGGATSDIIGRIWKVTRYRG